MREFLGIDAVSFSSRISIFQTLAMVVAMAIQCCGQAPSGYQQRLPVVPNLEPRPGELGQERWRTERFGNERAPTAGFVDSLKVNDAVIEVKLARSKLLTTRQAIAQAGGVSVIAVSDPSVVDFSVLPDARMIRLVGLRVGTTDLTFIDARGQSYSFEIRVVYDLDILSFYLKQYFSDALVRLSQVGEHVVVEGQARSDTQVAKILDTIRFFLTSEQIARSFPSGGGGPRPSAAGAGAGSPEEDSEPQVDEAGRDQPPEAEGTDPGVAYEEGDRPSTQGAFAPAQIINLLTVPGAQQVMLQVQIAELNRTALRQIGTDLFGTPGNNILSSIGAANTGGGVGALLGIFDSGNFEVTMTALRTNNVATILAEPNLVTLDGHEAQFQSGGEFPVPVAQAGGGAGNNSVEFKDFGIQLAFVPYILDDGIIRLHVETEVSDVAEELGTTLVIGGDPIPGVRTRNASTTVELREGQTLAIAGLLDREVIGSTNRIPLLGDLPYIGPLFGSVKHEVIEQELVVAVTPYLVGPMGADERPPLPGSEIMEPNDLELYLLQRIAGRTGRPHRATTNWDNPFHPNAQMQVEKRYFVGPIGLPD